MVLEKQTSETIDFVRFPLAVMVVFIHSIWQEPSQQFLSAIRWSSLTVFEALKIYEYAIAKIMAEIAVPTFFFISGYLFFRNLEKWDWAVWRRKIHSRIRTLIIPYILWVTFFVIYLNFDLIYGIVVDSMPLSLFWDWFCDAGGLRLYWDSSISETDALNWLGGHAPHSTGPYPSHLWFLRDLISATIISPLIYWLIRKMGLIFVCFLGIVYITRLWPDIHGIHAVSLFFFSSGAYFSIEGKDLMTSLYHFRYMFYTGALVCFLLCLFFCVGPHRFLFPHLLLFYICLGVVAFLCFAFLLVKDYGFQKKSLLVNSCFFLYVFHPVVQKDCNRILHILIPDSEYFLLPIKYLLFPIMTSMVCVLLYSLLRKLSPQLTSVLTGGR